MTTSQIDIYETYVKPLKTKESEIINEIKSIEEKELRKLSEIYLDKMYKLDEKEESDTNIRKGYYKQEKIRYLDYVYLILIVVYIIFYIISCVRIYRKEEMKITKKVIILIILFILPIFSTKILLIVLFIIQGFYKYLPKNVHMEKINLLNIKH